MDCRVKPGNDKREVAGIINERLTCPTSTASFPISSRPSTRHGRIKTDVLGTLCDDLIEAGVHGLTPLGSTGEFAYLDREQRAAVVQTTIEAARQARAGDRRRRLDRDRRRGRRRRRHYQRLGADGILAILEAYFPLKDAQVESYFRAIADAVDIPVVLYTNPQFQRSDLSLDVDRAARRRIRASSTSRTPRPTPDACCRS